MCHEVILQLFNSDNEEDYFSGFSAQKKDEDTSSIIDFSSRVSYFY